jgi:hypothetical protein
VAWIVKVRQEGRLYRWQAVRRVDSLSPGEHCIWHLQAERLTVPSGNPWIKDAVVADPFSGWDQRLRTEAAQVPWFGALAPGPFWLHYRARGHEHAGCDREIWRRVARQLFPADRTASGSGSAKVVGPTTSLCSETRRRSSLATGDARSHSSIRFPACL